MNFEEELDIGTEERDLLELAVQIFHKETGIEITGHGFPKCEIIVGNFHQYMQLEVKPNIPAGGELREIISKLQRVGYPTMLVTNYLTPKMGEKLKEANLWFLDTVGNAYVNLPPIYIDIRGKKRDEGKQKVKIRQGLAFKKTALKLVYLLIVDPELVQKPYRTIAKAADIALGTVVAVLKELIELGFVVDRGKRGRRVSVTKELIDRWVTGYIEQLRPTLIIGQYTPLENLNKIKQLDFEGLDTYWGGEVAAERLTGYLKPAKGLLYTRDEFARLMPVLKIKKDPEGVMQLYRPFWLKQYDYADNPNLVPPLVMYADLIATGDPRNIETAEMIYDQEIARLIGEG